MQFATANARDPIADREQKAGQLTEKQSQMRSIENLNELRDRTLAALKLVAQSPSYKASKRAFERFIQQLQEG